MAYRAKIEGIEVRFDWTSRRWLAPDAPSFAKHLNAIPLENLVAYSRLERSTFPTTGELYINAVAKVFGGEVLDVTNEARRGRATRSLPETE